MQKGYLPYIESDERCHALMRNPQLSFDFSPEGDGEALSQTQIDDIYQAIKEFVESKRQPRPSRESARIIDAFYSFNVLPPRNIKKYLGKSAVYGDESSALSSDWEKVGLDLWSSVLRVHQNRAIGE